MDDLPETTARDFCDDGKYNHNPNDSDPSDSDDDPTLGSMYFKRKADGNGWEYFQYVPGGREKDGDPAPHPKGSDGPRGDEVPAEKHQSLQASPVCAAILVFPATATRNQEDDDEYAAKIAAKEEAFCRGYWKGHQHATLVFVPILQEIRDRVRNRTTPTLYYTALATIYLATLFYVIPNSLNDTCNL